MFGFSATIICLIPLMCAAQNTSKLESLIADTWAPHSVKCRWESVFGDATQLDSWAECRISNDLPEAAHDLLTISLIGKDANNNDCQLTVKGHARIFGAAFSVINRVKLGTEIKRENITEIECEWSALRDVALLDADAIVGKIAKRPLVPGRPILASDLKPRTVIKSGDPVVVQYEQGRVVVKVEGVAMKDGGIGDKIPVRVPEVEHNRLEGVIQDDASLRWIP